MKTIALLIVLALHATGLWQHVPTTTKAELVGPAAGISMSSNSPVIPPSPAAGPLPVRVSADSPDIPAAAAIATDQATATVLYAKDSGARRPIASVTKLITALVILSRHSPDETVTIPTLPDYPVEAETMGLTPGDTFKLRDLLAAALVPSANDAADALAIYDAGSVTKFAARMNAKMTEWGITDTRFVSASGLQDEGNYASAAALAKIAGLALSNPTLSSTVGLTQISLTSGQGRTYNLKTTNELLASGQFYGIKTGYTLAAGECFVGVTRINGHAVITVVLGADNRFSATTKLTNWIGHSWQWL